MKGNNDKQLASDFDKHLKRVLTQLSFDLKQEGAASNKDTSIIKAKKSLMDILVTKTVEYLKVTDSEAVADIIHEICK